MRDLKWKKNEKFVHQSGKRKMTFNNAEIPVEVIQSTNDYLHIIKLVPDFSLDKCQQTTMIEKYKYWSLPN